MITLLPTPIGNLYDVSLRMLDALARSEIVLCEDTRITKKLISLLSKNPIIVQNFSQIFEEKKFFPFHSHNQEEFLENVKKDFFQQNVVFLSDAGMPCVNDPGALLVRYAQENQIPYDVLPGSNACILAYCLSGVIDDGFIFGGFLPHKQQARRKVLESFFNYCANVEKKLSLIFYESPHRILESLLDICVVDEECEVFAVKEMSKLNQKYFKGSAREVARILPNQNIQGEWVLVLNPIKPPQGVLNLSDITSLPLPPKIKAKLIAKITNEDTKKIYQDMVREGKE